MRQITAAEVKPGMEVQFDLSGWDVKGTVATVDVRPHAVWIYTEKWCEMSLDLDSPVTVLAEPQPEEPVTLCARIVVAGRKIYRWTEDPKEPWPWRGEALNVDPVLWSWGQLCGLGHVTVIDADPSWTLPAQVKVAPVVPERIEEWPEDDTALRPYKWRGRDGYIWKWLAAASEWECYDAVGNGMVSGGRPSYGPWARVTDA